MMTPTHRRLSLPQPVGHVHCLQKGIISDSIMPSQMTKNRVDGYKMLFRPNGDGDREWCKAEVLRRL